MKPHRNVSRRQAAAVRQTGAALLMAMLTVTLVATFAAAALWQQWRSAEVEAAERARMQSAWVLIGALDWSRLILSEDGRTGSVDNLTEPWAVPLEEAKLTAFLSADKNIASDSLDGLPDAFLSGSIVDAQSKLNVRNLVTDANFAPSIKDVEAFKQLFSLLGLPAQEVTLLTTSVQQAVSASAQSSQPTSGGDNDSNSSGANTPLMPLQEDQLTWFGLSPSTVAALAPYVTVLPFRTTLNINTASAEVLAASTSIGMAGAKRLTMQRMSTPFKDLDAANRLFQNTPFNQNDYGVSTSYFEVLGRLRLDDVWVEERSLLKRVVGSPLYYAPTIIWRQRGAGTTTVEAKP